MENKEFRIHNLPSILLLRNVLVGYDLFSWAHWALQKQGVLFRLAVSLTKNKSHISVVSYFEKVRKKRINIMWWELNCTLYLPVTFFPHTPDPCRDICIEAMSIHVFENTEASCEKTLDGVHFRNAILHMPSSVGTTTKNVDLACSYIDGSIRPNKFRPSEHKWEWQMKNEKYATSAPGLDAPEHSITWDLEC